jgi:hypothetical protein
MKRRPTRSGSRNLRSENLFAADARDVEFLGIERS